MSFGTMAENDDERAVLCAHRGNIQDSDEEKLPLLQRKDRHTYTTCGSRHVIAVMSLLSCMIVLAQRAGFTIALVSMVNYTQADVLHNSTKDVCPENQMQVNKTSTLPQEGEFQWDGNLQSALLSAFFYGYMFQLPGGYLAERYGVKYVVGFGVLLASVFHMLVPVIARWNVNLLIACRVLTGIVTTPTFPGNSAIWSNWAPLNERATMIAFTNLGGNLGMVIGQPLAGLLCSSTFLGGWPSVFYVFGSFGVIWFIAWIFLFYDNPSKHPRISEDECLYIETSIGTSSNDKYVPVPWCSILKSTPQWAMSFSYLCNGFGFNILFSCFPIYLREVLKYGIENNGLVNSGIFLSQFVCGLVIGTIIDRIIEKKFISTTSVRKLSTLIGHGAMGIGILSVAWVECNSTLALTFVIVSQGIGGAAATGYAMVMLDMAPKYSGTLTGLSNGIANIAGILAPMVVEAVTHGTPSRSDWQKVFYISACFFGASCIVFTLFGSAEKQPWARPELISDSRDQKEDSTSEHQDGHLVNT